MPLAFHFLCFDRKLRSRVPFAALVVQHTELCRLLVWAVVRCGGCWGGCCRSVVFLSWPSGRVSVQSARGVNDD